MIFKKGISPFHFIIISFTRNSKIKTTSQLHSYSKPQINFLKYIYLGTVSMTTVINKISKIKVNQNFFTLIPPDHTFNTKKKDGPVSIQYCSFPYLKL